MSFEMRWYLPDRVMFVELRQDITASDIIMVSQILIKYLQFDPQKYVIIDGSRIERYPTMKQLQLAIQQTAYKPSPTWVITYGFQGVGIFLLSFMAQVLAVRFRHLENLEACLKFRITWMKPCPLCPN